MTKDNAYLFLVMSYHKYSLKHMMENNVDNFSEEHVIILIYNLLCSLKYMHSLGLLHRDIKPSNILVNTDCTVKICDFGWARTTRLAESKGRVKRSLTPVCFSRLYRPPEVILQNGAYNDKADIWSIGCIVAALALKSKQNGILNNMHMFQGKSCFPISPHQELSSKDESLIDGVHKKD